MTINDEATPRPWTTEMRSDPQWWIIPPPGDEYMVIASTIGGNDQANAQLIVTAVNQHQELLDLVDNLRNELAFFMAKSRMGPIKEVAYEEAREVLARARKVLE